MDTTLTETTQLTSEQMVDEMQELIRKHRRELEQAASALKAKQREEAGRLLNGLRAEAIEGIQEIATEIDKKLTRERLRGELVVSALYHPLPDALRAELARVEAAADEGERPVVVLIPRETVGGNDYLKPKAYALVEVTASVYGQR